LAVISLLLLVIVGFTYMARLLGLARERTRQYANLSWGVLSGLIRTLDERDSRAARHCAAVAKFSRDIAKVTGMSERDQELARTAPDTYRMQMNAFEALTELRRVAGKQLDAIYVEALAQLLAGQGTDYRHADEADFDRELDIERRMNEAAAP